jgi:hypothetical protein
LEGAFLRVFWVWIDKDALGIGIVSWMDLEGSIICIGKTRLEDGRRGWGWDLGTGEIYEGSVYDDMDGVYAICIYILFKTVRHEWSKIASS